MRVAIITGSRADYGLLNPLIKKIDADSFFDMSLIVCGQHLEWQFGHTIDEIKKDNIRIFHTIDIKITGRSASDITKSVGYGCIEFSELFKTNLFDLVIILGDRFEILSAAIAAMFASIPIAHIHGGEVTEGAVDESIRHAISKMSNLHFVAAEQYKKRLIQMGEVSEHVHNFGAIGLDNILGRKWRSKKEVSELLSCELRDIVFLVTYHPETLSSSNQLKVLNNLLTVLEYWENSTIIITGANSDESGTLINDRISRFATMNEDRVLALKSLGQNLYLDVLSICDVVIGNSSSGIIEAPSFRKPTVNVGDRQKGRIHADSIINCETDIASIQSAVTKALSQEFKEKLSDLKSPFGNGNASDKIVHLLKNINIKKFKIKPFIDVDFV